MKDKKYYKKLAQDAAKAMDFKKAEEIKIYDVESKTGLFYYAIVATAISSPHIKAIEEEVITKFKKEKNEYLLYRDGITSQQWKVLDYGGIVIHIFDPSTREFYGIDKRYDDCKKIEWNKTKKARKTSTRTKPKTKK
ncbi:MAG: ribosome silencing factor [Elusimicrobiota bacterium]